MCPSDVYKIYKSGSNVRVDTTLSGFEQMSWQRGARTYIFTGIHKFTNKSLYNYIDLALEFRLNLNLFYQSYSIRRLCKVL